MTDDGGGVIVRAAAVLRVLGDAPHGLGLGKIANLRGAPSLTSTGVARWSKGCRSTFRSDTLVRFRPRAITLSICLIARSSISVHVTRSSLALRLLLCVYRSAMSSIHSPSNFKVSLESAAMQNDQLRLQVIALQQQADDRTRAAAAEAALAKRRATALSYYRGQ